VRLMLEDNRDALFKKISLFRKIAKGLPTFLDFATQMS
jgi:hypothetical protein